MIKKSVPGHHGSYCSHCLGKYEQQMYWDEWVHYHRERYCMLPTIQQMTFKEMIGPIVFNKAHERFLWRGYVKQEKVKCQ